MGRFREKVFQIIRIKRKPLYGVFFWSVFQRFTPANFAVSIIIEAVCGKSMMRADAMRIMSGFAYPCLAEPSPTAFNDMMLLMKKKNPIA